MAEASPAASSTAHDETSAADHAANVETTRKATESGYLRDVQVYEPHRAGLPPLIPYVRELWRRREFAAELSRATMRAANTRTFFGQLWLVLNPLLLAAVYYFLVGILGKHHGGDYLSHLVAGLFAYYFVSGSVSSGAQSVVSGGSLIANMAFPRLLMPLSAVRSAFFRFLPTLPVFVVIHLVARGHWSWTMLLGVYFLGTMILLGSGLAAFFATLQVYFRDTSSFLPYFIRIWLYLSPVLWFAEDVRASWRPFMALNPLYPILGGWTDLVVRGQVPPLHIWLAAAAWGIAAVVIGSLFFMSREREFAVRL